MAGTENLRSTSMVGLGGGEAEAGREEADAWLVTDDVMASGTPPPFVSWVGSSVTFPSASGAAVTTLLHDPISFCTLGWSPSCTQLPSTTNLNWCSPASTAVSSRRQTPSSSRDMGWGCQELKEPASCTLSPGCGQEKLRRQSLEDIVIVASVRNVKI